MAKKKGAPRIPGIEEIDVNSVVLAATVLEALRATSPKMKNSQQSFVIGHIASRRILLVAEVVPTSYSPNPDNPYQCIEVSDE